MISPNRNLMTCSRSSTVNTVIHMTSVATTPAANTALILGLISIAPFYRLSRTRALELNPLEMGAGELDGASPFGTLFERRSTNRSNGR